MNFYSILYNILTNIDFNNISNKLIFIFNTSTFFIFIAILLIILSLFLPIYKIKSNIDQNQINYRYLIHKDSSCFNKCNNNSCEEIYFCVFIIFLLIISILFLLLKFISRCIDIFKRCDTLDCIKNIKNVVEYNYKTKSHKNIANHLLSNNDRYMSIRNNYRSNNNTKNKNVFIDENITFMSTKKIVISHKLILIISLLLVIITLLIIGFSKTKELGINMNNENKNLHELNFDKNSNIEYSSGFICLNLSIIFIFLGLLFEIF